MVLRLLVANFQSCQFIGTLAIAGDLQHLYLTGIWCWFLGNLLYASWFQYVTGAVIILLGLHQMESYIFKGLLQGKKAGRDRGKGRAIVRLLLGLTLVLLGRHVWGPVLGSGACGGCWLSAQQRLVSCWCTLEFGATIFGSSSVLQLCFETFSKTPIALRT